MNHKKGVSVMNAGEFFGKYIGIAGIAFLLLIFGYIYMATQSIPPPEGYTELLSVAGGFFFAKNGGNAVATIRKR